MEKDALWLWLKNHAQSPFPSSFTCATEGNSSPLMWFWYSTDTFFQLFQILMMAYFQKNIIWTFEKLSLLQAILFEKMNLKPPNGEYDVTVFQWCLWKTNTLSKVVKYIVEIRNFGHLDRCPKFYWCIFIGSKQDCKKNKKNPVSEYSNWTGSTGNQSWNPLLHLSTPRGFDLYILWHL